MLRQRKLRFRNLFLLIFISYIVVLAIPIGMMGAIYFRSETVVQDQIMNSNQAVLQQMRQSVDGRLEEIRQLGNQIFLNKSTQKLMNTSGKLESGNMMKAVSLIGDLSSYKNITPFIDDFFVYFQNLDYFITSSAVAKPAFYYDYFIRPEQTFTDWKQSVLLYNYSGSVASPSLLHFKDGRDMFCFWQSVPGATGDVPLGNICIMVSQQSFQALLAGVEEIHGGMAFVMDQTGKLLFSSESADTEGFPILAESSAAGELEAKFHGQDYVFSYVTSEENGLRYITAFPRDILQAEVGTMRRFAQLMIYLCVSIALLLILVMTYQNYRPIRDIARQFDDDAALADQKNAYQYIAHSVRQITHQNKQFEEAIERHQPLFRSNFLMKLVHGTVHDPNGIKNALASYGVLFEHEDFAVILIHIEDGSTFMKDNSEQERNYIRLIVSNIGEEVAETAGKGCMVESDMDTFCMILNLKPSGHTEQRKSVRDVAERIKKEIEHYFGIIMTAACSGISSGYEGIHQAHLEAVRALDYRLIQGVNAIICYEDLKQTTSNYCYSTETENHLINFVRTGDYPQAKQLLTDLFTENFKNRRLSIPVAKCLFFDIVSTAIKLLDMMNIESEQAFSGLNPAEELLKSDTIGEMQEKLLTFFKQLCDYTNGNKKSHNDTLKESILQFIAENYQNENLSQTMIADQFNISSNYLSNFFHEQTGKKMSAYLAELRIQAAKQLLRDTDDNMGKIAAAVGFTSDLSLIRVFKKVEGLTPGQYRMQAKDQEKS